MKLKTPKKKSREKYIKENSFDIARRHSKNN